MSKNLKVIHSETSLLIQLALSNYYEEDSKFPPALIYLLHLHTASASNLQQTFFKKCFCATLEPLKILSKVFNSSKAFFSAFLNKIILPLPLLGVHTCTYIILTLCCCVFTSILYWMHFCVWKHLILRPALHKSLVKKRVLAFFLF